ncbi:MAG: hypothetical protein WBD40_16625, partial [Tepidisphaeraceae bacterium]
ANCIFTFGGVEAQISGEGRLYVDEGRGVTGRAKENEAQYFNVVVTGDNNQVVTASPQSIVSNDVPVETLRQPAFAVLREMRHVIDGSSQLSNSQKIEANTYVNLIELQLKKPDPDRRVIAAVLDPLGKVAALASHVANLIKFFNG